ncbi:MAG: CinA family nicotinamide mononucleotide deamidase-related protein [Paludibacteraceae bacterium]|nr:CinA family nicotinamide mononucleotide deamidase-related protein [Paludibacteraceae bacterium]
MQAEIITIGDELLIGQVVDTNSAWMAERLNEQGIEVCQITSIHDSRQQIIRALDDAFSRADIVLTTGGLGPTKDDITKHVLCEYFHTDLVEDTRVREHIQDLYKERPDVLNRLTATQWQVPQAAEILPNRVGSAPLMVFRKESKMLASMPGVPYEMKIAMQEQILPYVAAYYTNPDGNVSESSLCQTDRRRDACVPSKIIHRTLLVSGISESGLALRIEAWEDALPESMHLAYLPKDGTIRLRLSSYGEATAEEVEAQIALLRPLIEDYLIATDDEPIEVHVGQWLKARGLTIATAESCTGGKLASLLNKHAGSSAFYMGSVVAYDNRVKEQVLGVSAEDLKTHGAVSEEVVKQMANGVRNLLHTDFAIATSGIAGPDGGTPEKPVGTVWIGWATPGGTFAECFHLGKLREQVTDRACQKALIGLWKIMQKG